MSIEIESIQVAADQKGNIISGRHLLCSTGSVSSTMIMKLFMID